MKAVCLPVNYVIEDIDGRSSQTEAEKTANRPADSGRDSKFLSECQSCKYEYILNPVPGTHYLQESHASALLSFARQCLILLAKRYSLIESIDIQADNA
jgi:hypothetical protein